MDTRVKGGMVEIVPREVTQAKLDRRSAAAMRCAQGMSLQAVRGELS